MKVNAEKLSVSNERLSIIGRLIGIYREERRNNSQNSWTQKRFCKDICSPNTLKNMETGGLSRSIEIYVEMLDKFDLKLGEFPEIDKAVYRLTEELYEAIEDYDLEKINALLNRILRVLNEVNQYVYYSGLYRLFKSVKRYYESGTLIENECIDNYKMSLFIYPVIFSDLFRFLLYSKNKANSVSDKEMYREFVEEIDLQNSNHNFVKSGLIDFYYIMDNYKKMEILIDQMITEFNCKNRFVRELDIYSYAIVLFSEIEFEKCMEYKYNAEALIKEYPIPEIKISDFYYNVAYAYHLNSRYEIALEYYEKVFLQKHRDYIDSYIFMGDCQNRLYLSINIPLVEEFVYAQYPTDIKLMYKYFTLDSSIPVFMKENYIIKKIAPLLTDPVFVKVFRFEILKLVNESGHYKCTHLFDSMVERHIQK